MIRFENISIRFNNHSLFNNFNLEVKKGGKVLIYGKSGIGKSTLINLVLGFQKPDSGTIYFNGSVLDKHTVWEIRRKVGYVSQDTDLGDGRISEFFHQIFSYHANKNLVNDNEELNKLLSEFDIEESILEKNLQDISGGERQRIAIITSLLLKRELYLLDEPTAALDAKMKNRVARYFAGHEDWSVLVISHDQTWKRIPNIRIINLEENYGRRA